MPTVVEQARQQSHGREPLLSPCPSPSALTLRSDLLGDIADRQALSQYDQNETWVLAVAIAAEGGSHVLAPRGRITFDTKRAQEWRIGGRRPAEKAFRCGRGV